MPRVEGLPPMGKGGQDEQNCYRCFLSGQLRDTGVCVCVLGVGVRTDASAYPMYLYCLASSDSILYHPETGPYWGKTGGSSLQVHIHLPSPWNSAEADNVQTGPRCVAALPGTVCPFPLHPTTHLPCDLPLTVSGALPTHPLMGERERHLGDPS